MEKGGTRTQISAQLGVGVRVAVGKVDRIVLLLCLPAERERRVLPLSSRPLGRPVFEIKDLLSPPPPADAAVRRLCRIQEGAHALLV